MAEVTDKSVKAFGQIYGSEKALFVGTCVATSGETWDLSAYFSTIDACTAGWMSIGDVDVNIEFAIAGTVITITATGITDDTLAIWVLGTKVPASL